MSNNNLKFQRAEDEVRRLQRVQDKRKAKIASLQAEVKNTTPVLKDAKDKVAALKKAKVKA